jgi:hypothetical protein
MFERFTDHARRVVVYAQEESRLLAHDHIGSEHLLLGLLHDADDPTGRRCWPPASPWTGCAARSKHRLDTGRSNPQGIFRSPPAPRKASNNRYGLHSDSARTTLLDLICCADCSRSATRPACSGWSSWESISTPWPPSPNSSQATPIRALRPHQATEPLSPSTGRSRCTRPAGSDPSRGDEHDRRATSPRGRPY